MRMARPLRQPTRHAVGSTDRRRIQPQPQRRFSPAFGLESLDLLGIDIDQDPRAFAKFLELRNRVQDGG